MLVWKILKLRRLIMEGSWISLYQTIVFFIKQHWRINLTVKLTMSRESTDETFLYIGVAEKMIIFYCTCINYVFYWYDGETKSMITILKRLRILYSFLYLTLIMGFSATLFSTDASSTDITPAVYTPSTVLIILCFPLPVLQWLKPSK